MVEVCSYRLSLRGKSVGSQILRTQTLRHSVRLEARLVLEGALGQATVTQTSSLDAATLLSQVFSETQQDLQDKRHYRVLFDEASGLVKATRGKDSAEAPYSRPYRDPLGLLHLIRSLREDELTLRVAMLGKDVLVERLPDAELRTSLGVRTARVYALTPGPAYVFVDRAPPHAILKLVQKVDAGLLEASLVKVGKEEASIEGRAREVERGRANKRRSRRSNRKRVRRREDDR